MYAQALYRIIALGMLLMGFVVQVRCEPGYSVKNPETVSPNSTAINMEVVDDLFIVEIGNRGKDDEWLAYRISYDSQGGMQLEGLVRLYVDFYKNMRLGDKPHDATLTKNETGEAIYAGDFRAALEDGRGIGMHHSHIEMLQAYNDYMQYPELYPADSVAVWPSHKYALVDTYINHINNELSSARKINKAIENDKSTAASWWMLCFLLPILLSIVTSLKTAGLNIAVGFHQKSILLAVTTALNILVPLGLVYAMVLSFWYIWVIYALATLFLQAMNIRFGLRLVSHIKYARGGKFPWLPAIAFAYVGLPIVYMVPGAIAVCFADVTIQNTPVSKIILGIVLSLALLTGIFFWFKKSICRNAPWLSKSIFPIAITILSLATSALALCVFIIALLIFKGSALSFASDSEKAPTDTTPDYRCGTCRWHDTASCPYLHDSSVDRCSSYLPK